MGHPSDIFVPAPPAGCICAICHDVLEDASAVKECGHTFCAPCIEASLDTSASCPNCRMDVTGYATIPNYTVREIVDALHVRCPEWEGDDGEESDAKKRKRDGDDSSNDAACSSGCTWKGPLKDLENHGNVCEYKMDTCSVEGCHHACQRKDMESHLSGAGLLMHLDLMKQSIVADNEKKIEEAVEEKCNRLVDDMEENVMKGMNHMKYVNDCRSWIEYKPDALADFSIYQIRRNDRRHCIVGLLCVIPGPKGSAWEGARIPMTLRYSTPDRERKWGQPFDHLWSPPKCKFPEGFFHNNVYESGTIEVNLVNSEEGWATETTLPEILFCVQQLLSHPNFSSPANREAWDVFYEEGPEQYQKRARAEAAKYSNYSGHHPNVGKMIADSGSGVVGEVEICEKAESLAGIRKEGEPPKPPPFPRDESGNLLPKKQHPRWCGVWLKERYGECECSCCAWGQVFWDDHKKTRFLFGVPG